jgi:hypothetical protein
MRGRQTKKASFKLLIYLLLLSLARSQPTKPPPRLPKEALIFFVEAELKMRCVEAEKNLGGRCVG